MRVFPIILRPARTRRADGQPCPSTRVWYRDTYDAPRRRQTHGALDVFAPEGSPVVAPEAGIVLAATNTVTKKGGWWLKLRSGNRVYYMAHLRSRAVVSAGDRVAAGQLLGHVGRSGNAALTCPHLHISARDRGRKVNLFDDLQRVDPTRPTRQKRRTGGGSKTREAAE